MDQKAQQIVDNYLESVRQLFADVESWLQGTRLSVVRDKTDITEGRSGTYPAPYLRLNDEKGRHVAAVRPKGAWIIAAKGRVDVEGRWDTQSIVYLEGPGPQVAARLDENGDLIETSVTPIFRNVKESGWYWIEDKLLGRAHGMDKDLFLDLVRVVSDYAE
ncbi:MAG: hypothetical protein V1792_13800 [Pseudomonadota bacterium]